MPEKHARLQAALVDHLLASGALNRPEVAAAFRAVPRHLFLPDLPPDEVYRDEAIPTKMEAGRAISSSSQPAIMAIMLQQLGLAPGQRVLEIGAGTGYNAALLGRLVEPGGQVITIDIDDDIAEAARAHLAASGSSNVRVVCADGGNGYPSGAPYDRIILTVGAWDIAPAWYEQLRPGGRLVLPLRMASGPQESVGFDKPRVGVEPKFISQSMFGCGFMLLRGEFTSSETIVAVGPMPGLDLAVSGKPAATGDQIYQWLNAPAARRSSGLTTSELEVWGSLGLWLGLNAPSLCSLVAERHQAEQANVPCLVQTTGDKPSCFTLGLLGPAGIALLQRGIDGSAEVAKVADDQAPFDLSVVGYGPQMGQEVVQELLGLLAAWEAAGRPASSRLRLRVYGPDYAYQAAPGEVLVPKRWTKLVVDWPTPPALDV